MAAVINGRTYYRTAEVCRMVGISRNTLFAWLREGIFSDVEYRDWRGWRLFTAAQVETMRRKVNQVTTISRSR
jgi:DNA-binding transcriptional MerR regulator